MTTLNAIFSLSCPACGAPVPVYSATSALVVCGYCQSTLVRSGDTAVDSGKKSALIEDFSPLQLHTSGTFQGETFEIVGRLQIRYEQGCWNEWYVLFSSGDFGWLADFSGQYVFTRLAKSIEQTVAFSDLKAGTTKISYGQKYFVASDVRRATSVQANAQGELPFVLKSDEDVLSADFRCRNEFLTLDYSNGENNPIVFAGHMVQLNNLRCQNLRSNDQILASAGKLKGQRAALGCPNCGASLNWYPGVAQNIICPSCHSDINLDGGKATVMATHAMRQAQMNGAIIKLGEVAKIGGVAWTVIGFACIAELSPDETLNYIQNTRNSKVSYAGDKWYEYLLYHPQNGFMWLVQSERNWDISHSAETWPDLDMQGRPHLNNRPLIKGYDYGGKVEYAAGAFYWHIEPGDVTYYQDYQYNKGKLCAERTREELSWSVTRPVTGAELAQWFKRPELNKIVANGAKNANSNKGIAIILLLGFFIINLPAIFSAIANDSIEIVAVICFVVYYIIWHPFHKADDDDDD